MVHRLAARGGSVQWDQELSDEHLRARAAVLAAGGAATAKAVFALMRTVADNTVRGSGPLTQAEVASRNQKVNKVPAGGAVPVTARAAPAAGAGAAGAAEDAGEPFDSLPPEACAELLLHDTDPRDTFLRSIGRDPATLARGETKSGAFAERFRPFVGKCCTGSLLADTVLQELCEGARPPPPLCRLDEDSVKGASNASS